MEIRFYQMTRSTLPSAVTRLAEKARARGDELAIIANSPQRLEEVDEAIWSGLDFLPHSLGKADGVSGITLYEKQMGGAAEIGFYLDDNDPEEPFSGKLICCLFHSMDQDIVAKRRQDWVKWKNAGHHLSYWAEDENGQWKMQAQENVP